MMQSSRNLQIKLLHKEIACILARKMKTRSEYLSSSCSSFLYFFFQFIDIAKPNKKNCLIFKTWEYHLCIRLFYALPLSLHGLKFLVTFPGM